MKLYRSSSRRGPNRNTSILEDEDEDSFTKYSMISVWLSVVISEGKIKFKLKKSSNLVFFMYIVTLINRSVHPIFTLLVHASLVCSRRTYNHAP